MSSRGRAPALLDHRLHVAAEAPIASSFSALMPSGSKRIIRSPQMRSWSWSSFGTPSSAPMTIVGILAAKSST